MTNKTNENFDLDAMFATERDTMPLAPDDLMARIMQDAQDQTNDRTAPKIVTKNNSWLTGFLNAIGGWQSVTALTACACFGLYLGYSTSASNFLGAEIASESTDSFQYGNSFSNDAFYDVSSLEG